jgi:hypothetical protein
MKRIILCIFAFCISIYASAWGFGGYATDVATNIGNGWQQADWGNVIIVMNEESLTITSASHRFEYDIITMKKGDNNSRGEEEYWSDAFRKASGTRHTIRWVFVQNEPTMDIQIYIYHPKASVVFNVKIVTYD